MTCATISVAPRLRTRRCAPPRGCGRSRPLARQESARATCGFRRSRSAPGRPPAVAARNAPQVLRGTSWTGRSSRQNRWHRDDRSNARAGGRGRVRRRTPPARRRATHAPARQGCGAAFRPGFRSPWLVLYKAARWLPLDAAGLVDHRERLREACERIGVGGRAAFLRGGVRIACFPLVIASTIILSRSAVAAQALSPLVNRSNLVPPMSSAAVLPSFNG